MAIPGVILFMATDEVEGALPTQNELPYPVEVEDIDLSIECSEPP